MFTLRGTPAGMPLLFVYIYIILFYLFSVKEIYPFA